MALSKTQQAIWNKALTRSTGSQGVSLSGGMCAYLVGRIAGDLELEEEFPEFTGQLPEFYSEPDPASLKCDGLPSLQLYERLVGLSPDADMYFACLSSLLRARLKYDSILKQQPMPSLEQVGPRGLLQYGVFSSKALTSFMFWRKWFFDIDNRAGQETGYLFEPIIAHAIGGVPVPASKSPVRRRNDQSKGRQVDCLLGENAYEIKLRVTIAASGQGRWREELDFPEDCNASGHKPVLVCLDGTENPKLTELRDHFISSGGEAYIGDAAWEHLDALAGETMSVFLDKYVRTPIHDLLESTDDVLLDLSARLTGQVIRITVGDEILEIERSIQDYDHCSESKLPEDAGDGIPGHDD